jgi:hypothetical protein
VAECIHGAESLESGLLGAAMAKVLGHGDSYGVACTREHRRCARQPISARRRIRDALRCLRRALELYEVVKLGLVVGGGHLDAPYSNQGVVMACDRNLDGQTAVDLSEDAVAWPAVHAFAALVFHFPSLSLIAKARLVVAQGECPATAFGVQM